ncbi:MAG: FAD-binding oxidoreductase [Thermoleophilia bacterium]|nr:FAD-binding oxidoreductase [Thermoleophilia bacterium]MDH5333107.1 FAD-binding oxidoreductase [Thermoleophilia bacterium]
MPSLWLSEPAPRWPDVRLDGPADVVVVGGGVTGCSCALTLARAGLRVRLQDAREIAGGASGRNGGFALRGGSAPYDVMRTSMGADAALRLWRTTEDAIDEMEVLAGDALRRLGSLRIAVDDEERDELRAEYDALVGDGIAAEWVDDLQGPLRGRFTAALRHPTDAALQPARWVRRLAALAVEAGVEIREHARLGSLDDAGGAIVVVCTDGYPSRLLGELDGLIVPTRGQVIATEPLEELWFEVPHYGRHGFDYWHQTPDGRIVAGGFRDTSLEAEFTDVEETTPVVLAALEGFVASLAGRPLRVDYRWAGIFGLVLDFLPVVGRVPGEERAWVAGGYSGHGNVLGYLCGQLVARAIVGDRDPLLDHFEPARLLNA